jgi:hypothetical protein
MQAEDPIQYYASPGIMTDPGPFHSIFSELPQELTRLCEVVHGLMVLDFWIGVGALEVSEQRRQEVYLRSLQQKLERLLALDDRPLDRPRPFEQRLLSNSRDLSLFLCAALRFQGRPARLRSGFATFFDPQRRYDHWLVEVWDEDDRRWRKIDLWMDQIENEQGRLEPNLREGLASLEMNTLDVQEDHFVTGGFAWEHCRSGAHDPEHYGTFGDLQGLWFVRDNMLRDLLCLNKIEVLPWDCWGFISGREHKPAPIELPLLDQVANLTQAGADGFHLLRALDRQTQSLRLPAEFIKDAQVGG